MLATMLLFMAQGAAPQAGPQPVTTPATAPTDIVVVGHRAEKALAACLARNCPPAEEVEASLQASVEQFADGRYDRARQVLQTAIRRNRQHAAQLPGPVSSLYATLATVAEHEGDSTLWRQSARNNVLVLRRHLGETAPATLIQELSFANDMAGLGSVETAEGMYAAAQRRALASGRRDIAAGAAFRRAWLALARRQFVKAEALATESVGLSETAKPLMGQLRDILLTRISIYKGNDGAVDALAARLRQSAGEKPRLLFSRSVEDINASSSGGIVQDPWNDSAIRYADVGYWIRPDGRTADAEVLRDAGLGQWRPGILKQVGERRYVPFDIEAGNPGVYRIDRFTVRGTIGTPTGTRIGQRMGRLTVHIIDLTETEAMSAAARERTASARTSR